MKNNKIDMFSTSTLKASRVALALLLAGPVARADYKSAVLADGPLAYYRLNDAAPADIATNNGSLGASGNGTYRDDNDSQTTVHRVAGALAGNGHAAASFQSS